MTATTASRSRWGVCALLFGATLLNYLDRQTLSNLAPLIRAEMHLDTEQLGRVFSAFLVAYTIGQILAGLIIDRVNVRIAYAVAVALWSLMGAGAGFASGLTSLLLLRAGLGFFEGANWPSALRVVSRTFVPAERSLASGIFQSGVSIGAAISPAVLIGVAGGYGWRSGFIAIGGAGLVWVALWLFFMPRIERAAAAQAGAPSTAPPSGTPERRTTVWQLLMSRKMWGVIIGSAFMNPYLYFVVNWLPTYFVESGQPFGDALRNRLTIIYVALGIGYVSGGALATYLARRMEFGIARRRVITAGAALMATIVLTPKLANVDLITALMCLGSLGLGWFTVNLNAFGTEVSHDRVSTVSGILGAAGSMSGAFFVWFVGFIAKASGGFGAAFFILGMMPVVAWLGIRWMATAPRPATVIGRTEGVAGS
jgi:ACS family hexuronate transporter-like MFS transporter